MEVGAGRSAVPEGAGAGQYGYQKFYFGVPHSN